VPLVLHSKCEPRAKAIQTFKLILPASNARTFGGSSRTPATGPHLYSGRMANSPIWDNQELSSSITLTGASVKRLGSLRAGRETARPTSRFGMTTEAQRREPL